MNKYSKLLKEIVVYGIGNLGSKVLSFILVPIYTAYLSSAEYGTVDLAMATVSMLMPVVSACIAEAVLRFTMDKSYNKSTVLSNAFFDSGKIYLIFSIIIFAFNYFFKINNVVFVVLLIGIQIIESIFSQYVRAIGQTKKFATKGIILTFTTGIYSLFFIVFLKQGAFGYLIAILLAHLTAVIYMFFSAKIYRDINIGSKEKNVSKSMYSYSIPLVPNYTIWWLINSSNKYFINYYHSDSANGIYAVASKIPAIISLVTQVFSQAWQISAIENIDEEDNSDFYSGIFNSLSSVLFLSGFFVLLLLKPGFSILFNETYYKAWTAVPFLYLGAIFSSFSGFLGANYVAAKETKNAFKTSLIGGIISIILNWICIPSFGIFGASLASAGGFGVMWIIRYFDTKNLVQIKVDKLRIILNLLLYVLASIILLLELPSEVYLLLAILVIQFLVNWKYLYKIIHSLSISITNLLQKRTDRK